MTMYVVALTPGSNLGRLRPHLGTAGLIELDSADQLAPALRKAVSWVVIDPMALSHVAFGEAVEVIARAGVRTAFFTPLSGFVHTRLLASYERLLPELIFRETDDDWQRMRDVVRRHEESVAARILSRVAPATTGLDDGVRGVTLGLFAGRPIPADVVALATLAATHEKPIRAQYHAVGLAHPHDLLDIGRIAGAYYDLRDGESVAYVGELHGLGSGRTVERRLMSLARATPAHFRRLSVSECASALSNAALRSLR